MYENEIEKRRYTGSIGEACVEFITWNYASGIKRGDKNAKRQPGSPDYDVWFKNGVQEYKYGLEIKTKGSIDCCVIDDKVLYNLIRTQQYDNEERCDIILSFLFWDVQEIYYILLSKLIGDKEIYVESDWSTEILSSDGNVINQELLDKAAEQLLGICDSVSNLTYRYKSKQVNMVYNININRLERYPYHFLRQYGFLRIPKLDNVDVMTFVQYYLEQRNLLKSRNVTIIYHNAHKIKRYIDNSLQIEIWDKKL